MALKVRQDGFNLNTRAAQGERVRTFTFPGDMTAYGIYSRYYVALSPRWKPDVAFTPEENYDTSGFVCANYLKNSGGMVTRAIVEPILEEIVAVSRAAGEYVKHVEYEIGNPLSLDDLLRYENSSECVLPRDYREFLQAMNGLALRCYSTAPDGTPRSLLYTFKILGIPEILVKSRDFRKKILDESREDESPRFPFPERSRSLVESSLLLCPRNTLLHQDTSGVFRMSRINMFNEDFLTKIADTFPDFLMESLQSTLEHRGIPPTADDD